MLKKISVMSKNSEREQKGEQVLIGFGSRTKKTVANMERYWERRKDRRETNHA